MSHLMKTWEMKNYNIECRLRSETNKWVKMMSLNSCQENIMIKLIYNIMVIVMLFIFFHVLFMYVNRSDIILKNFIKYIKKSFLFILIVPTYI